MIQAETPYEMGTDRLEAFSDGVMAVIITIMAFGLRVPTSHNLAALHHLVPGLLVYILSFAMIGIYWNNHHHLLRATNGIGAGVMWANLCLLFWLSLIPLCTAWISDQSPFSLPAATYGAVLLGAALTYTLLVRAIIRANGRDSLVAIAIARDAKGYASLALYAAGVGLAFISPLISYALYLAVGVIWVIPDPRFTRR